MATIASIDAHTAEEFRAATESAAVFPSNGGRLRLTGEDARDLLNRLSTNLVDPDAESGEVAVTVLTSDRGRIVDLVYVIHCGDHQLMITSAGQQQAVIEFLDKYTIMEELEVEDVTRDTVMLTVTGPEAREAVRRVLDGGNLGQDPRPGAILDAQLDGTVHQVIVGEPIEGERSFAAWLVIPPTDPDDAQRPPTYHLVYPNAERIDASSYSTQERGIAHLELAGAVGISAETAEALRIVRGQPAYGSEMSETYNPLEAGLIGAIDFHKGCYIGQEVIARLDTYHKVQKYMVTLRFEAGESDVAEVAAGLQGARLNDEAGSAMGLVTSATVVPTADGADVIGLGYVRTAAVEVGGRLTVASDDGDSGIVAVITAQPLLFGGEKPGLGN
ncbi:MAG: hypothetical protein OXE87_12285 [Chloroflexi bacterium]|nr:hypothetical protein [Chloroflexota bacterium]